MPEKTNRLIIVGEGETAELAYEYFTHDSFFEVAGFSAERQYVKKTELFGLPVVPFEDVETRFPPGVHHAFVALSYTQLNRPRTRLYLEAKRKGYPIASYVSSRAFVWRNVEIGENCFILEHNVLQYHVKVGNNVVLWSGNHVGHRSIIRDNTFISSHVVISGYCDIGESCFVGVNASIGDHVKIAPDCIVGAGALILKDTEHRKVYRGSPASAWHVSSHIVAHVKES